MTVDKRKGLDFTLVLWYFASFKLHSPRSSIPQLRIQNKPRSRSRFFIWPEGGQEQKRKSERLRATMETCNSFAVRTRGLLPANSLIAVFLRVFLPLYSPPWPFCDGNGPRLASVITVRIPDSPFRSHAAAVCAQKQFGKIEPALILNLLLANLCEEMKSVLSIIMTEREIQKRKCSREVYQSNIV